VTSLAPTHGGLVAVPEIRPSPNNYDGIEIPACLVANVERHCANLHTLVQSLGNAGIDEATIEASVLQIVQSYHAELMLNIRNLHRGAVSA
jgi:hypothetical protein